MKNADWAVLVVDDEPMVVRALSFLLEDLGFLFCTASNSLEAIAAAQSRRDGKTLAVIDLNLGDGMNGMETMSFLHDTFGIPGILTSGAVTEEVKTAALQAGAVSVLQKPFTAETLKEALGRVVGRDAT